MTRELFILFGVTAQEGGSTRRPEVTPLGGISEKSSIVESLGPFWEETPKHIQGTLTADGN